jgi:hypothetical protein
LLLEEYVFVKARVRDIYLCFEHAFTRSKRLAGELERRKKKQK